MPLRDHFHSPWSDENLWEGFHSAWANTLVRHLNGSLLPAQYRAVPKIHHVATFDYAYQDTCEVGISDTKRGACMAGAIEFISPGNKDRPETRSAFAANCASYLRENVGLIMVDIVTIRDANLHEDLIQLIVPAQKRVAASPLYAASYRTPPNERRHRVDIWLNSLELSQPLPTLPMWLSGQLPIPIDLEASYEETCGVLRIPPTT
jgi:hypothetical protein